MQTSQISATSTDVLSGVVGGEWWIGADPGLGLATPLVASASNLSGTIVATLTPGSYTVSVRSLDAAGNWSGNGSVVLTVTSSGGGGEMLRRWHRRSRSSRWKTARLLSRSSGSDPDSDPLTSSISSPPADGTLSGTTPNVTYTPSPNFNGPDSFAFTVNDGAVDSPPAIVTIGVTAQNDPPTTSTPPTVATAEGSSLSIAATTNDVDGDVVSVSWTAVAGADVDAGGACSFGNQTATTTVTCTDEGTYALTATASDGHGGTSDAVTSLSVSNANPVVNISSAPSAPVLPGTSFDVTASFSDAGSNDTHSCTIDWGDGTSSTGTVGSGSCAASHTYATSGTKTVIVTVIDDDNGGGTASITVVSSNRTPSATAVTVTAAEDTAATVTLAGTDPDGDGLSFTVVTAPAHGTLSGTGASRTYTPAANFNGADSFTFVAVDPSLATSAPATASITVTSVNDQPVAGSATVSAVSAQPTNVVLSGSDVDGDALTYVIVSPPTHGALSGSGPAFVYTSISGYVGSDSFSYAVSDSQLQSATMVVPITVTAAAGSLALSMADDAAPRPQTSARCRVPCSAVGRAPTSSSAPADLPTFAK